ncbi:MAG: DsbA family protein [Micrococcales bacterium]|nr:DsbA family protein [Micrococcales bacterium]
MQLKGISVDGNGAALPVPPAEPQVAVSVFLDFMCPFCQRFSLQHSATLVQLCAEGHATLRVYPIAFLDRFSQGTEYSTRTAGAAYAVAADSPGQFMAFEHALFTHQPREGTEGLTDEEIAALAAEAGVDPNARLTDPQFRARALEVTRDAIDLGVQGTPTVLISSPKTGDILWDGQTPIPAVVRQVAEA